MPELPEVETLRRELRRAIVGKKIKRVRVHWSKTVAPLTPATFGRHLRGREIIGIERMAKVLVIELSTKLHLLIHLKMTGQLIYRVKNKIAVMGGHPEDPNRHTRAIFDFTDGTRLYFNDLRKFGWLRLADDIELARLGRLVGIEPLGHSFIFEKFNQLLEKYPRRKIKQLLLDQTLIAGLGNIYADEICFAARVLPTRAAATLTPPERRRLHHSIIFVLKLAVKKKGTSTKNYVRSDGSPGGFIRHLKVYGRAHEKCKRCGETIHKIKFNGRGTHFCPSCQR